MLYIIFHKKKLNTRSEFDNEARRQKSGSHGHAFYLIQKEMRSKDWSDFKTFQAYIPKLKEYREKSDYSDEMIKQEDGEDAVSKADVIINILNRNF